MDDRIPAVIVGVLFSILNAVVTVYLVLKTGMMDGIILLLLFLSAFIFLLARSATPRAFIYLLAIVTGSMVAVVAYADGLGAIFISGAPFPVPDPVMMALLGLSGIIGMLMSFYFMDYFLKGSFPWPMPRANASLVAVLSAKKKNVLSGMAGLRLGASSLLAGTVAFLQGLRIVPDTIGTATAGVGISPMMVGIGMLIGFRGCLQMALGALASLAILLFLEGVGTDWATHMRSPWIFSTAISMLVTTAAITLYGILKPYLARLPRRKADATATDGGRGPRWPLKGETALLIALIAIASVILQQFVGVPIWIFLVCVPLAVLFQVIESRGRAEVAGSVGVSSYVVILLVGLAFDDIVPLLVLEGFVVAMVMSFSLTLVTFKMAEFSNVSIKGLAQMLVIGFITGSVIGLPIFRLLNGAYGIGSDALPAPFSVMWLEMARTAVSGVMSPSINFYLVGVGIILALVLNRYKISAVSVALGMILPLAINAAIFVGGLVAWYAAKRGYLKDDNGITASGLIAGDVLVGLALSLRALW